MRKKPQNESDDNRLHPATEWCTGIPSTTRTYMIHDTVQGGYCDVERQLCVCLAAEVDEREQRWRQILGSRKAFLLQRDSQALEDAWQECERLDVHLYDDLSTQLHYTSAQRMALAHYRVMEGIVASYKDTREAVGVPERNEVSTE